MMSLRKVPSLQLLQNVAIDQGTVYPGRRSTVRRPATSGGSRGVTPWHAPAATPLRGQTRGDALQVWVVTP